MKFNCPNCQTEKIPKHSVFLGTHECPNCKSWLISNQYETNKSILNFTFSALIVFIFIQLFFKNHIIYFFTVLVMTFIVISCFLVLIISWRATNQIEIYREVNEIE